MRNKIGTFTGIPCYKMIFEDYMALEPKSKNEIYIIDGEMVLDNKVIGYYNGKVVTEYQMPYKTYIQEREQKKEFVMPEPLNVEAPQQQFMTADEILAEVYMTCKVL